MASETLQQLLVQAAQHPRKSGITFYDAGNNTEASTRVTYDELYQKAQQSAVLFQHIPHVTHNTVFLLHFDNHLDGIRFFWSTIFAGYVPAISTPFTNDAEQRKRHLGHLQSLLRSPIIITRKNLLSDFSDCEENLNIWTIEQIQSEKHDHNATIEARPATKREDIAVLMLTSGSTGHAKAVALRHQQILASVKGKASLHGTRGDDTFLNWIGFDHVANLTEVHLHAMSLAAEQVQVSASDMVSNPLAFVKLLNRHRVAYTFAPNFFLASLRKSLEKLENAQQLRDIDLSCLRAFISGGEANVTETCDAITRLLGRYGASGSFVRPGFGMTETCAGSIYNTQCPQYDLTRNTEFTSLGSAIPGLAVRITRDDGTLAHNAEVGNLEVSGPVVFKEYFNDPIATMQSFTQDGWFITGDKGSLDTAGKLSLSGRVKESIIINGVKHFPHEIEGAIEDAAIKGIAPSYTAVFPHRPPRSPTETLCVVYLPTYDMEDTATRIAVRRSILEIAVRQTGARPFRVIPLTKDVLPKTTLGKLSRAKLRAAFESGAFAIYEDQDDELIRSWRQLRGQDPTNPMESTLLNVFMEILEVTESDLDINISLFEMGVSSVEMLRLKSGVEKALNLQTPITITTMMAHPSIRSLAQELSQKKQPKHHYNPVVTLNNNSGTRTRPPLWLIHPGVGEILIFLHLAKYIIDRPIYALRSRGFDGEGYFSSLHECITTYHSAIKSTQPTGPYALLGYSYGGTLAFELAKLFHDSRDEVKFLGVMDQPPHIQARMRHSDWPNVALTLARFLSIIDNEEAKKLYPVMQSLSHDQILDHILSLTTTEHLEKMAVNTEKLANWTSLALNNHIIARKYEPTGTVPMMDIFYAAERPDAFYALSSGAQMLAEYIGKWKEFVRDGRPVFHEVHGSHDDMIKPVHVEGFVKVLRGTLEARGL